jgi:hypothetical protein
MTTQVILGGKEYTLRPLPRKKARYWRAQLQNTLDPLLTGMQNIMTPNADQGIDDVTLIGLIRDQVLPTILTYPDLVWDLLLAYAPNLAERADELDERATDAEVMNAFVEAVQQAYPLGEKTMRLIGRLPGMTSTNLHVPNGQPE